MARTRLLLQALVRNVPRTNRIHVQAQTCAMKIHVIDTSKFTLATARRAVTADASTPQITRVRFDSERITNFVLASLQFLSVFYVRGINEIALGDICR